MSDVAVHKRCKCRLCERGRRIQGAKHRGCVKELTALVDELHNDLSETEDDLNYQTAILDGSWPQAREILERSVAKCPTE